MRALVVCAFLIAQAGLAGCSTQAAPTHPAIVDSSALAYFQLAQEEAQKEHLVEAEAALRKALQITPSSEPIAYSLGIVLEQLQDFKQAEEVFAKLPDSPRKAAALRRARLRSGDDVAIKDLAKDYSAALASGDFNAAAKVGRALAAVYTEFGRVAEASCLLYEINQY